MNQTIPFVFDRLKFEGVPLSDIPREDLAWLVRHYSLKREEFFAVTGELRRRRGMPVADANGRVSRFSRMD